jgi:hypothetical protein
MSRSKSINAPTDGARHDSIVAQDPQNTCTIDFVVRRAVKKHLRTFSQFAGYATKTSIAIHNVHLN